MCASDNEGTDAGVGQGGCEVRVKVRAQASGQSVDGLQSGLVRAW